MFLTRYLSYKIQKRYWLSLSMLVFLIFFVFPVSYAAQKKITFDHLTIEQGLSQNSVLSILQDRRGFVWFGTWDGLNRYDGYHFTTYKNDPADPHSLSSSAVFALFEDSRGILWAGTQQGGGLNKYERDLDQWTSYQHDPDNPNSLSDNDIYAITEDRQGNLWIGTAEGLNRFDPKTGQCTRYLNEPTDQNSLSNNKVYALHEDHQGSLWVGTSKGLNRLDRSTDQFTRFLPDPSDQNSLSFPEIFAITETSDGILWIGTSKGGLNRFDKTSQQFTIYLNDSNDPKSLGHNQIRALLEDQTGILWIATYGGGVDRFDREQEIFSHYQPEPDNPRSLGGNVVAALHEDETGVVWIGTEGEGVSKYDPKKEKFTRHYFVDPKNSNSLNQNYVRAIYQDRAGILWVGTYGGGLNRFDPAAGQWSAYQASREAGSLNDNVVLTLHEDQGGDFWVGTRKGMQRLDRETGQFSKPLISNFVRVIYEDQAGSLWVGTWGGGLSRFDRQINDFVKHYRSKASEPTSLSQDMVTAIYEDRAGVIWVGTLDNGLNRLDQDNDQFTRYQQELGNPDSLSHNRVTVIYEAQNGTFWIGTAGGLNSLDRVSGTFRAYKQKDGLPNDVIYDILEDDRGNLWISTNLGLSKFTPSTGVFRNYDVYDGLQSNEFSSGTAFKNLDGEMFFGGINGLNVFHPDDITDNPHRPPVVLTDFQIFNTSVTPSSDDPKTQNVLNRIITETDAMTLSWRHYVFSFEFAALDFTMPEQNRYAYIMEGFEKEWNDVGTRRFATYTNLPGGRYTFRVKGSNNDGVWNEEGLSLALTVTPPPWKTWWAYTLYALTVIGFCIGYIQYKQMQYKRERAILDRFVPYEYLNFLKKKSILDVKLGDHVSSEKMAVMFSDIRSFTTISETMTPQENFDFVNAYLKRVAPVIRSNDGFIVKFLGDGMMAVFPNGAEDGVNAAIGKLTQVKEYNVQREQEGWKPIKIGIGVHTGHMMVGMVGEKARMQGDAFSDNVNLTARLEGLTKYYGVCFLISGETYEKIDTSRYYIRFLDNVAVKGKELPIKIYEVFDADDDELFKQKQQILPIFQEAQAHYFEKRFKDALRLFNSVLNVIPDDNTTQLYIERCETYLKKGIPAEWDGVRKMDKK